MSPYFVSDTFDAHRYLVAAHHAIKERPLSPATLAEGVENLRRVAREVDAILGALDNRVHGRVNEIQDSTPSVTEACLALIQPILQGRSRAMSTSECLRRLRDLLTAVGERSERNFRL